MQGYTYRMKSRAHALAPWVLGAAFVCAAAATALYAAGLGHSYKPLASSWISKAGAGLIGPACGSSSASAPTCSGATPSITLTWASDAVCDSSTANVVISGSTVGSGSCSGSYTWTGGSVGATYSYEITTTSYGSAHSISTGSFTMPSSCAPTATLSASPSTIDQGQSSTLSWNSTNATSCTAGGGYSTGGATSGSASTGALSQTSTYQVTCSGLGGTSAPAFATVTVRIPTISIGVSPNRLNVGSSTTVTWNATEVNSCTITKNGAAWKSLTANASRVVSGSASDSPTTQTTYLFSCSNNASGSGAAVTATQVVNINPGFQEF